MTRIRKWMIMVFWATRFEHKPICWVYDEMTIATRGHKPTGIRFGGTNLYGWKCHLYYNQQRIKKQKRSYPQEEYKNVTEHQ